MICASGAWCDTFHDRRGPCCRIAALAMWGSSKAAAVCSAAEPSNHLPGSHIRNCRRCDGNAKLNAVKPSPEMPTAARFLGREGLSAARSRAEGLLCAGQQHKTVSKH